MNRGHITAPVCTRGRRVTKREIPVNSTVSTCHQRW